MHLYIHISVFLLLHVILHVGVLIRIGVYALLFDFYLNVIEEVDYRHKKRLLAGDEEKRENLRSVAIF